MSSSGSDEYLRIGGDDRKRKRMESNRESARRSRQRKQKHLTDLTAQINQLKQKNGEISNTINLTAQKYRHVESENCVLKAQMAELSQRLQSLDDILNFMNSPAMAVVGNCMVENEVQGFGDGVWNANQPWSFAGGFNQQPIMASAEMFMDY